MEEEKNSEGPQDLRNQTMVSFLGFLFASLYRLGTEEVSNLKIPRDAIKKRKKENRTEIKEKACFLYPSYQKR